MEGTRDEVHQEEKETPESSEGGGTEPKEQGLARLNVILIWFTKTNHQGFYGHGTSLIPCFWACVYHCVFGSTLEYHCRKVTNVALLDCHLDKLYFWLETKQGYKI